MNAVTRCAGCRDGEPSDLAFGMAFQPIVDVETGRPFAYEALVRGPDGEPAAEVLAQVTAENRYVFDQACRVRAIETATAAGILDTDARLSINFLSNAVYSPLACIQLTLRTAERTAFPVNRLIFEFTEHEQMMTPEHVGTIIETYRRLGMAVAIDDFGAGHSGLGLLARFSTDIVKLDMGLVHGIDSDRRRQMIVQSVATLCRELDTILVAEGIETVAEANTLNAFGIRHMQGYLFARPGFETLPPINLPN